MGGSITEHVRRFVGIEEESSPAFECRACGTGFEKDRQVCPDCGGFDIRRGRPRSGTA